MKIKIQFEGKSELQNDDGSLISYLSDEELTALLCEGIEHLPYKQKEEKKECK